MRCRWLVLLLPLLLASRRALAQQPAPPARVGVFLDCQNVFCDFDYVRREITFVDWVRDRADADVHLLLTSQGTGGGGAEYTLAFIGLRRFAGTADTLKVVTRNTDTDDETRAAQVKSMKLGLVRFVASSPAAEHLTISYEAKAESTSTGPVRDPWNAWVYQVGVSGSFNGEQTTKFSSLRGSLSANRITEDLKVLLSASGNTNRSEYQLTDSSVITNTHNYSADGQVVWSLGPHWSAGATVDVSSATRTNQKLTVMGGPALEFDFYPYAQSTRQQVTLQYSIQPVRYAYQDTTVFNVLGETRVIERLQLAAGIQQPWGSINGSIQGQHYLDNLSQHSINIFGGASLRIFRGLNLNVFGEFNRIKDQIYLPKTDFTDQDILLQQVQIGTDYSYFVNFGLSYRFGSKVNNVVNPRFNGGGSFFFSN